MNKKKILLFAACCLVLSSCGLFGSKEDNTEEVQQVTQEEKMNLSDETKDEISVIEEERQEEDQTFLDESQRGDDPEALQEETFLDESQRGEDLEALQEKTILDESQRDDTSQNSTSSSNSSSNSNSDSSSNSSSNSTSKSSSNSGSNSSSSNNNSKKQVLLSDLKVGQKITIDGSVNVYTNAKNALANIDSTSTYNAGTYTIYKIQDGALNITRNEGEPGGWVNPNDLKFIKVDSSKKSSSQKKVASNDNNTNSSSSSTSESTGSKSLDQALAMKQGSKYSWSWSYPGEAANKLQGKGGYGKLSSSGNNLYLTFDNGYEYKNLTSDILDTLAENNVKATFFVTSQFIKSHPQVVKRMVNEGHLVGNHSRHHKNHSSVSAKETYNDLKGWESDFNSYVGSRPSNKVYRPPEGKFSDRSLSIANAMGYNTVLWSYAYSDWDVDNQPPIESSLNKALDNNFAGSVVLLHAISQTNADMLDQYIKVSKNAGYSFKLLP